MKPSTTLTGLLAQVNEAHLSAALGGDAGRLITLGQSHVELFAILRVADIIGLNFSPTESLRAKVVRSLSDSP